MAADMDSPARSTRGYARRQSTSTTSINEHVVPSTIEKRGPGRPAKSSAAVASTVTAPAAVASPPAAAAAVATRRSSAVTTVATHLDAGNFQELQQVTATLDKLKTVPFPKRGLPYSSKAWLQTHKQDLNDPLLVLCAKACALCGNRALAPKEFVLVLTRRFGWVYQ